MGCQLLHDGGCFSGFFIPRQLASISQCNAVGEHGQSRGLQPDLLLGAGVLGPTEAALLQALGHHPQATAIPVKQLEQITPLVGEDEHRSTGRIGFKLLTDHRRKAVEAFAHVTGLSGQIHPKAARKTQHDPVALSWEMRMAASLA